MRSTIFLVGCCGALVSCSQPQPSSPEDQGGGGAGGSAAAGAGAGAGGGTAVPSCPPERSPWMMGMCVEGPDGLPVEGPGEVELRVVGNAAGETPSCFRNNYGPWPTFRVNRFGEWEPRPLERWTLEDEEGRAWVLEVSLPGLPEPLFEAGQEVSLLTDRQLLHIEVDYQVGSLRVDRGGELVVAVGQRAAPAAFTVEELELDCEWPSDSCSNSLARVRVSDGASSLDLSSWQIERLGEVTVAHAYYELHTSSCPDVVADSITGVYRTP